MTVRKNKLASSITDYTPFARADRRASPAATSSWRSPPPGASRLRDGATALADAPQTAALDDLLPTARDQASIDRMTLLALDECRNKRLLPRNHEAIRQRDRGAGARGAR